MAPVDQSSPPGEENEKREQPDLRSDGPEAEAGPGEPLVAGTMVGPYRIMCLLGRGSAGEIYLVRDEKLGRKVALKMVHADRRSSKRAFKAFARQAGAVSKCSHPHIGTVYAVGAYRGRPYVAQEHIEGQSLADRIAERQLSLAEALRTVLAVAEALDEAHRNKVRHLDLKPESVIIPRDGRIRVVDFAVVRLVAGRHVPAGAWGNWLAGPAGRAAAPVRSRPPGCAVSQLAPEQWRREKSTSAADIWALGVVAYELLSGRLPFEHEEPKRMAEAVCGPEPARPLRELLDVPEKLSELVGRCLDKDASKRPQAAEVGQGLRELLGALRRRPAEGERPFRGLEPFTEEHAHLFFGREAEVAAFLERVPLCPVLAVVGPAGGGKSSFVRAGIVPRLLEQERWTVLQLRPGGQPFRALASVLRAAGVGRPSQIAPQALRSGEPGAEMPEPPDDEDRGEGAPAAEDGEAAPQGGQPSESEPPESDEDDSPDSEPPEDETGEEEKPEPVVSAEKASPAPAAGKEAGEPGSDGKPPDATSEPQGEQGTVPGKEGEAKTGEAPEDAPPGKEGEAVAGEAPEDAPPDEPAAAEPAEGEEPAEIDELGQLGEQLFLSPRLLSAELRRLADQEGSKVLLFVDQLEELLTLTVDPTTRRSFMRAICAAADDALDPLRVIFAARDDSLGRLATEPEVREVLEQVTVIQSLEADALQHVLSRPVEAVGFRFEDEDLPREMAESVRGEATGLPLLQYAADLLWNERDEKDKLLTRAAYELLGGVPGALASHADDIIAALTPTERSVARELLLRLVTLERTRKLVPKDVVLDGLALGGEAKRVLERLTSARLVTETTARGDDAEGSALELAHESLIDAWGTLSSWIDRRKEDLAFLARLGAAEKRWARGGRAPHLLLQGKELAEALSRLERCSAPVPEPVGRFAQASERHQAQAQRWKAPLFATVLGVLVVATAVLAVQRHGARVDLNRAAEGRALAERRLAATELEGATAALTQGRVLEARAKLRGALEQQDTAAARALWWELGASPLVWLNELGAVVYALAFSPDGRSVAASCQDQAIYVIDVATGAARVLRGPDDQILTVAFSPSGNELASGCWNGEVWLWDLKSGAQPRLLRGHSAGVQSVSFSPDGRLLASGAHDKLIRLWNVGSGKEARVLRGHSAGVNSVAFSPDGKLIVSAGYDRSTRLWDVETGNPGLLLRGHEAGVRAASFSADGKLIASAGDDGTLRLWEAATGKEGPVLRGHTDEVRSVAFSANGKLVASASLDRTVRLWNVASGGLQRIFEGHTDGLRGLAFSPDGRLLASGGYDKSVRLWDVESVVRQQLLEGHTAAVNSVSFSPDGKLLASGANDSTVRLWDVASGTEKRVLEGHTGNVQGIAFHPQGTLIASASQDKTMRLWDVESGAERRVLSGHTARVWDVSFSPDGALLASSSYDKTVRLWVVSSGEQWHVLQGHVAEVYGVAFSPDSKQLATGSRDQTIRLWQLESGEQAQVLVAHTEGVYGVAFSPDGRRIASGSADRSVRLWDIESGDWSVLGEHAGRVYHLAFSPDGTRLGSASSDGTARIWDVEAKTYLALRGHQNEVNWVAFGPRGDLAATASDDGTVRLWDTATGRSFWRAPVLLRSPPRLLSHRGWLVLARSSPGDAAASRDEALRGVGPKLRHVLEERTRLAEHGGQGGGGHVCVRTHDDRAQIWAIEPDKLVREKLLPQLDQVLALPDGCAARAKDGVWLLGTSGKEIQLAFEGKPTAIGWGDGELLVAAGTEVLAFELSGRLLRRYAAGVGVSALAGGRGAVAGGGWLAIGFRDGNIEIVPAAAAKPQPAVSLAEVPWSPPLRILPGPGDTLIVGFANGLVGIWDRTSGSRLAYARLHGPVVHLLIEGQKLYAASDLGRHLVWDLDVFYQDYCELLREIWNRVPVVWEGGRAVVQRPGAEHRCAPR
ncbi:MAG: protein kinase [Deltaproteobacteria bacterium]|nr:protein kinase [Deltaproteobacteria bacterium]